MIDIDAYRISAAAVSVSPRMNSLPTAASRPRFAPGALFLKGPIALDWLAVAAKQPGKTLHVGVALWFLAGLKTSTTVALTTSVKEKFGIGAEAAREGLQRLEESGLVSVVRAAGAAPRVTLLEVTAAGTASADKS